VVARTLERLLHLSSHGEKQCGDRVSSCALQYVTGACEQSRSGPP
jgi:hypothetical protein